MATPELPDWKDLALNMAPIIMLLAVLDDTLKQQGTVDVEQRTVILTAVLRAQGFGGSIETKETE